MAIKSGHVIAWKTRMRVKGCGRSQRKRALMSGLSTVQLGTPYNNMSKKSMNLICHGNFVIASTYTAGEQGCYGNN